MTDLQKNLEALFKGLQLVNAQGFIRQGSIGDYRRLGQMIFENGKANHERIRELKDALKMIHSFAYGDDAHGFDDDEALERIRVIAYKALERGDD